MPRAVVLAGGWAHPGDDLIDAVHALLANRGFDVSVVTDPQDTAGQIAAGCDLFVVGCCWFDMADDRYSDAQRREHAVPFDGELRDGVVTLLGSGCPVLALHTAVISFDSAQPWVERIGGSWNWATSGHPEPAPMMVRPSAAASAIEFDAFSVVDELYQGLDVHETAQVVAESPVGDPLVWLHEHGGRAAVNLLGHDQRSLGDRSHVELNERLLDWLLAP